MEPLSPILTVSQLNRQVKIHLENAHALFQVEGEVSNLSKPASGHLYFTLKDQTAQVRCVYFKSNHRAGNPLIDGQHIIVTGSPSLYEARGDYQLLVKDYTEAGLGILYQRFQELKDKLAAEGLFNPERKRPLPFLPQTIGLITSPTGAAIQDMLSTLARRFPLASIRIYPSEVQGNNAAGQLIRAVQQANQDKACDVLILARGGGSIEDLWAFNDEALARAIAASSLPIITGIGQETDFTIADFVASHRAETPTAAATAATPDCKILLQGIADQLSLLVNLIAQRINAYQAKLLYLTTKLSSPEKTIANYSQRLDYLEKQLQTAKTNLLAGFNHRLSLLYTQLQHCNPAIQIPHNLAQVKHFQMQLIQSMQGKITQIKNQLIALLSTLHAVSPLATLDRGYAIASKNAAILYEAEAVSLGDTIDVRLSRGSLSCQVQGITPTNSETSC